MSEWKSLSRQFERDMREAFDSVRAAIASADTDDLAGDAPELARTIVECAVAPLAAFVSGLPRAMDVDSWQGARRWSSRREWDDEA